MPGANATGRLVRSPKRQLENPDMAAVVVIRSLCTPNKAEESHSNPKLQVFTSNTYQSGIENKRHLYHRMDHQRYEDRNKYLQNL